MSLSRPAKAFLRLGSSLFLAAAGLILVMAAARADDSDWPRQFSSASGTFIIYQPQPESLDGDLLSERAAFSLQKDAQSVAQFGVLWFTERVMIDRDSSLVSARNFDVTRVRLPDITRADASRYEKLVEGEAAGWDLSGSLEELQSGLAAAEEERASVSGLEILPPRIIFSYHRAILVAYDGAPILEPVPNTRLQRVSNTPYAVVYEPSSRNYYLNGANLWYVAKDPEGPWADIPDAPPEVRAVVPPDTSSQDRVAGARPLVLTATQPTELIAIDGQPKYAPLVDDELLYVTNTESDVVREVSTQTLYVLLAGRWYESGSPDGGWKFIAADALPSSFARIPAGSPKAHLLASVAGTDQSQDALADAEIPQTSAVRRGVADFEVIYDGEPEWTAIEGTDLQYAANADAQVIRAGRQYFLCDQGVWYISDSPYGPWAVSDTRPIGVDDIPPSSPVYDTRYVYIYDSSPEVVFVGYLPGYIGSYPFHGAVVYGTGYHYRPWHRRRYFARPFTWGFQPHYNPWLSRWSFGFSYGSGFLRVGSRWPNGRDRVSTHTPPLWFGPGGYRRSLVGKDMMMLRARRAHPNFVRSRDALPSNLYNRSENVGRVDRAAVLLPMRKVSFLPLLPRTGANNVFAGRDGRVYQRDNGGAWKVQHGSVWVPAQVAGDSPSAPSRPGVSGAQPFTPRIPAVPSAGVPGGGPRRHFPPRGRMQPVTVPAAPVPTPSQPSAQPSTGMPIQPPASARPRPVAPPISPGPGNLEREFKARARAKPEAQQEVAPKQEPERQEARPAPSRRGDEPKAPEKKDGSQPH